MASYLYWWFTLANFEVSIHSDSPNKILGIVHIRIYIYSKCPQIGLSGKGSHISLILPLCDEMIVAVGNSDDNTRAYIESIGNPKIKIIDTIWDDSQRTGGVVLAQETDKTMAAIHPKSDYCLYVQGDECYHEKDFAAIRDAMERWKDDKQVEGLLLKYYHFYGSYDFLADSRSWYRHEIRIVKNNIGVKSWKDAQGFRINGRKLNVKPVDAEISIIMDGCVHRVL